ncbi:MAG: hypothetical protein SOT38_03110 [Oscillospiraceae bacterium]|nr:hypothetical protein [Oscillospiraceae bacterium]
MKTKLFMGKILTVVLTLCMVVSLVPMSAFATAEATETADFTAADGGAAALALLNRAKTGTEDSTWDNGSKTLVLKGIDFTTAATTALKLPDGAAVVLADGTENKITGGDAEVTTDGSYRTKICVYGIYAEGTLTVKGEANGTGTLFVTAGTHTNNGDAWTYSVALSAKGNINVEGGTTTLTGGKTTSADCAFSDGIELSKESSLFVTGGKLTAIGGESIDTGGEEESKSFSQGIDSYKGNVSVSGTGKLEVKCDPIMDGEGLAYGFNILSGDLTVSDNAQVSAAATRAIRISNGNLKQTGGEITAVTTSREKYFGYSIDVERDSFAGMNDGAAVGNVEISGGTFDAANGRAYISQYQSTDNQGNFTVTGGTVKLASIYGVNKFNVSNGTVESQRISTDDLNLYSGSLTVREPVQKYNDKLYAEPAISCKNLTVNGGVLDVAWDWGEYTPIVFPTDEYEEYPTPLVKMYQDVSTAAFNGGTTILNTGCAGNTAIRIENVILGEDIVETGADDSHIQKSSDTPVMFSAKAVDTPINEAVIADVKFDYEPGDAPQESAKIFLPDDPDKYEIAYECWEEMENGNPVAFWYSDASKYTSSMERINQFEEGKKYMYSIELKAKDGYAFVDNCPVMVNNTMVAPTNVIKTQDGLLITAVKTITPTEPVQQKDIEVVEIINATITFKDGDKPVFTGKVPDNEDYAFRCEWWSLDSDTGLVSTEPEWGSEIYKNKITTFEAGKTYYYGVYVTAYYGNFSPDAKLKINGQYVNYKRVGDDDDMQSMWLETDLTMTPTTSSHTHSYGTDWESDADNHWHECSCGSIADKAAHDTETKNAKDATATEKGYTGDKVCKVCGYTVAGKEIPATGTTKPTNPTKPDGNKDVTSPQTGDNSNLALWFAVLFVSFGGMVGCTVYGRRRKLNKR